MIQILRNVKATMMLADHAQSAEGKLNIIGGGWTVIGPGPAPLAIALAIEMPWDYAGADHTFRLELLDDQGIPVQVPGPPVGDVTPVIIEGSFPLAAAPGIKRGTPLTVPIAINMTPGPPLPPGARYEWRLEVDGETHEDWRLGFSTRPQPPQAMAA